MIKKIGDIISTIITIFLIITLLFITVQRLSGEVPSFFGYRIMVVQTGSMEPEIKVGDAILIKSCDVKEIGLNTVVCYESLEGETKGLLITHKVVTAPYENNGVVYLVTKGVANLEEDKPIKATQVVGKLVYKFYTLGAIYSFFKTVPGLICTIALIVFAMVNEIIDIVKTYKAEVKEEMEDESKQSTEC